MSKFKVGDEVKIVKIDKGDLINFSGRGLGENFIIEEVFGDVWCRESSNSPNGVHEDLLELVRSKTKFKVGDRVRTIRKTRGDFDLESSIKRRNGSDEGVIERIEGIKFVVSGDWFAESDLELAFDYQETINKIGRYYNEQFNGSKNKVGEKMDNCDVDCGAKVESTFSSVVNFVKKSLLSADEKLLRKYGLKDSCGEFTREAERVVMNKLVTDNEKYLIEVATNLQAEEKGCGTKNACN